MNRKIGFDNRLCYQREVARCQKIHQDKLRHIQPTSLSPAKGKLDNTAPQVHAHLKTNFKKAQMDSDKYRQIYGENQQLMRKMLKIVDTAPSDAAVEFRPGMRLNTDQTPILDSYVSVNSLSRGCAIDKGSMNGEFRQRQNDKIEDENRKMMLRIMTKKSVYSANKWDHEYKHSIDKFKHVHHDATVGYLSPKHRPPTSPYKAKLEWDQSTMPSLPSIGGSATSTPRGDGDHPSKGLAPSPPSPAKSSTSNDRANTTGCSQRSSAFIRQASKTASQLASRKQTYRTKCVPVLLLEATTSMAVHFTIEELQIAMVTPSATELGDQGFLLRAKKDDREGESVISLQGLKDIAMSLGTSILTKLDTIQATPNVGNFPRITQTLDESDLKTLLVKLVQCVRVSSVGDGPALRLSIDHKDVALPSKQHATTTTDSILDVFLRREIPPRFVLRNKSAIYLCHIRVYELRRLVTFHSLEVRTQHVVNYQFTEAELLPHFHDIPLWVDVYRTLLKLAMKRIRI
ncbi:Aste57867_24171 [Aphanomyces stellatus]|uniref:Aste57867_24171 protein n=1 Tax=Aphanomyces stellatus TaxID=120398 RepID=A0A485LRB0_9STRA|nr:hypothetical protein As57867_024097 [Aphanomyces stellatus]VFU00813.1 Aste57867_24171 [Aphanomyces stellatus]